MLVKLCADAHFSFNHTLATALPPEGKDAIDHVGRIAEPVQNLARAHARRIPNSFGVALRATTRDVCRHSELDQQLRDGGEAPDLSNTVQLLDGGLELLLTSRFLH